MAKFTFRGTTRDVDYTGCSSRELEDGIRHARQDQKEYPNLAAEQEATINCLLDELNDRKRSRKEN